MLNVSIIDSMNIFKKFISEIKYIEYYKMWQEPFNGFYKVCDKCSKWRRLYLQEKKKYEDLKKWTEKLLESNSELLEHIKDKKL